MKKCIICNKKANATGSHIIPASLIKKCVGKHYAEKSYKIDAEKSKISIYYGRDNLENKSTEIQEHHYKIDNILCNECEKKLANIEGKFAKEILNKYEIEKYKTNFIESENDFSKVIIPKKIENIDIIAYFYSIVLRFDNILAEKNKNDYRCIKSFLYEYLYKQTINECINDFAMVIFLLQEHSRYSYVVKTNYLIDPYVYYLCEAIIYFYTKKNSDYGLFKNVVNKIGDEKLKIIIGPENIINLQLRNMAEILAENFIKKAIISFSLKSGKSEEEINSEIIEGKK